MTTPSPLIDALLEAYRPTIGPDFEGYRNHCQRVWLVACQLAQPSEAQTELLAVAAVFHDIGLWTARTVDYLPPSVAEATAWLRSQGRESDVVAISNLIERHHQVTGILGDPLAEAFRRADAADLTFGWLSGGASRELLLAVRATYSNAGFHRRLMQLSWQRLLTHPLNPLPMYRWW